MTTRPKPTLAPVPPPDASEDSKSAEASERAGGFWERRRARLAVAVLALALVLCALALVREMRHTRGLEGRVRALSGALATAQAEVAAHRQHLELVRGGVTQVRDTLDALEQLVTRDPEPPAALVPSKAD